MLHRLFPAFISALTASLLVTGMAAAETFLGNAPDIPVLEGYSEVEAIGSAFDKPEGRIVEAFVAGRGAGSEALAFYAATLPQLGWTERDQDTLATGKGISFTREEESLTLTIIAETELVTVLLLQIGPGGE